MPKYRDFGIGKLAGILGFRDPGTNSLDSTSTRLPFDIPFDSHSTALQPFDDVRCYLCVVCCTKA